MIHNIKECNTDKTFDSRQIFKKGNILPGITQYSLDNIFMTKKTAEPYDGIPLQWIYDLKPLQNSGPVPLRIHTFLVMIFQPRKINTSELKSYSCQLENVTNILHSINKQPLISIEMPTEEEKESQ